MIRSIGTRLTLWYAGITAATLLAFGGMLWLALNHSLYHAIDGSLRDRIDGIRQFIEAHADRLTLEEMQWEFREHSVLGPGGDLFQVSDEAGNWLYRSDPLYDEHVPTYRPLHLGSAGRFENIVIQGTPLRFLSQNVDVQGRFYAVQVAAPLQELERGLREFLWATLPALPLALAVAVAGGYWISRRALQPVDEITATARLISADNLSERLSVPATADELERLSLTLNDMIERLEWSFKKISRFTADASHELRTPLALMRTTAEVALRNPRQGEEREALMQIIAESEHASQLVDNLLLISRADGGEAVLDRTPIDLTAVMREACAQAEMLVKAKGLRFDVLLPKDPVDVRGERDALRRLFLLLIDNAAKYTPTGGSVEVVLSETSDKAVVSIKDTGIGIPQGDLPYVFDRFYRVDESRSREQGGTGLGLAIGRWIVQAHDGTLSAASELGRGSVFTVSLPLLNAASARGAPIYTT